MPNGTLEISDGEYYQVNSMCREAIEEIREEKTIGKKTGADAALIMQ